MPKSLVMHRNVGIDLLLGLLLLNAAPTRALADQKPSSDATARAEAERLSKEGERLLEKHDAQAAIEPLCRAYAQFSNPRFLLPLGMAYAEAERPLDALEALGRFLKDSPSVSDAKRKEIGARVAIMMDQVAALVTLEATRQNAAVKVDDRPIGMTPIQTPLRLLPGKHEIIMQAAPTDPSSGAKVLIEVKPGERRTVKLEPGPAARFLEPQAQAPLLQSTPVADSSAEVNAASGNSRAENKPLSRPVYTKWWFWTAVGGGAAVLAVGLGAGLGTRKASNYPDGFSNVSAWPGGPIDGRASSLFARAEFSR